MRIKIHKGDNIKILSGRDRGKTGAVERVLSKTRMVVVTGLNLVKKHAKPKRRAPHGGIISLPAPMPIAKVIVICPRCQKPTRVKVTIDAENNRYRVCRNCQEMIDAKG